MEQLIKLPNGLPLLPQTQQLRAYFNGDMPRALATWYCLFSGFFYRMQDGEPPGTLPVAQLPVFLVCFEPVAPTAEEQMSLCNFLKDTVRLLQQRGEDIVCPRFLSAYAAGPGERTREQRGGDLRAYDRRAEKIKSQAFQMALAIPAERLVDADGNRLDEETCKRITRLVLACDNALFRDYRPQFSYDEALIQSALAVLRKYSDEEIDQVCRLVAGKREHPVLSGLSTEKMLPQFGDMIQKLEGK